VSHAGRYSIQSHRNPRPFYFSTTNIATRMSASRTSGLRVIPWRQSKSGRKKNERELRRGAKVAGVKPSTLGPTPPKKKSGFAIEGWSTVSSSFSGGGFKRPGMSHYLEPTETCFAAASPTSEPPHATTITPTPMTSTSSFRSGG